MNLHMYLDSYPCMHLYNTRILKMAHPKSNYSLLQ